MAKETAVYNSPTVLTPLKFFEWIESDKTDIKITFVSAAVYREEGKLLSDLFSRINPIMGIYTLHAFLSVIKDVLAQNAILSLLSLHKEIMLN